eukprot:scaffold4855_cov115-Isochrysis_galbana.AAC.6
MIDGGATPVWVSHATGRHSVTHFKSEEEEPLDEVAHLEVASLPRRVEADHEVDELGLDGARGAPGAGRGEVAFVGRGLWEVVFDVALDAFEGYFGVAVEGHDAGHGLGTAQ